MLLKSISNEIVIPITLIIHQSLETGIFPNDLNIKSNNPIYEKGDEANLHNYGPISILPTIYNVSYICNCMRISVKIIYYANSSTSSTLNILPN